MGYFTFLRSFTLLAIISLSLAQSPGHDQSSTPSSHLVTRDDQIPGPTNGTTTDLNSSLDVAKPTDQPLSVNCTDPMTGRSNACFAELKISDYIKEWITTHKCYNNEGFAKCYLRQNGFSTLDCVSITSSSCSAPQPGVLTDPKEYYAAYNIFSINAFFKTWYEAVGDASDASQAYIGGIASLINPDTVATATPKLSSNFADLVRQIRSNLNQTAASVLSNGTEFLAFAETGNFSAQDLALADVTNYLTFAFNTYIVSNTLRGNDIYSVVRKGTDVVGLATNGTKLAYPIDCKSLDENNLCDAFYYSKNYASTFGLVSKQNQTRNFGDLQRDLFGNLTTGELLFEASYARGVVAAGSPVNVTVTARGVETAFISQLDVVTWDMTCHADPSANGDADSKCEYLEVGKDEGFWGESKGVRIVPPAYLGPALVQDGVKISRS